MQEIRTSGSMSGDGKRSVAAWPKLPRPSSTLPKRRKLRRRVYVSFWGTAEVHGRTASAAFHANDPLRKLSVHRSS